MTYASWWPRHRVTTVEPGKLDVLVLTLVDGRRAAIDAVTDYEAAVARARAFVVDHRCQIKVLPLAPPEVFNMLGIRPDERPADDPAMRAQVVDRLMHIARESNDTDTRRDAFDALADMGVLTR